MAELCPEFKKVIIITMKAKVTIVLITGLAFGALTLFYGAFVEPPILCEKLIS